MTTLMLEKETLVLPGCSGARKISAWKNPAEEKRPYLLSFFLALAVHAFLFILGGAAFVKPAEYAIALTDGGMEISMIAALPEQTTQGIEVPPPEAAEEKPEMEIPAPVVQPGDETPVEKETPNTRVSEDPEHKGDGSSQEPGESSTTFFSAGEASAEGRPGYLKNPPPPYPREAVLKGQEGLVLLSVVVDKYGHSQSVELKQSSGFSLLDKAALKAVKKWKFNPGKMGFMATESKLVIPIRFRIEDALRAPQRA